MDKQRQGEIRAATTTLRYRKRTDWRKSVIELNMMQRGGNGTGIQAESMLSPLWTIRDVSGLRNVISDSICDRQQRTVQTGTVDHYCMTDTRLKRSEREADHCSTKVNNK